MWLLTGNAFDGTTIVVPFMDKMHVQLPELSVLGKKLLGPSSSGCASASRAPELLAAEADEQARSPCDSCAIHRSTRIALDCFFFPQDFGKTISSKSSAKILANGASCFAVEQGLGHQPCCKEYTPITENWLRKRYKYSKKNYKSTEDKHETNHINNKCNDMNMNTRKMHNT